MFPFALSDLISIVDGSPNFGAMPPVAGDATPLGRIVTDSRRVEPGDLFWALSGPNHNGADYACEAYMRGAEGVVAEREIEPWAGRWSLRVPDAQWAMWQLATVIRYRFDGQVIAVTGSVGKTTTREMIHTVLSSRYQGSASPKNFNNHFGLPLSMFEWGEDDDYAVVELGASGPGEIAALADLCQPSVGVVTRIAEAHLGGFGGHEALAESKRELISSLPTSGTAIFGDEDSAVRRMATDCPCQATRVGRAADCDLVATDIRSGQGKLAFRVENHLFEIPVWGRHHLTSALAAIAIGRTMNMTLPDISDALRHFKPIQRRCQIAEYNGVTVVDDTYNSCPSAMRAALELLRDFDSPGRRVVVCGDMKELGSESTYWHRQLGDEVVTVCGADLLIACGQYAQEVVLGAQDAGMPSRRAVACASPREVSPLLLAQIDPGDVVLVKGSRAMAMERVVDAICGGDQLRAA